MYTKYSSYNRTLKFILVDLHFDRIVVFEIFVQFPGTPDLTSAGEHFDTVSLTVEQHEIQGNIVLYRYRFFKILRIAVLLCLLFGRFLLGFFITLAVHIGCKELVYFSDRFQGQFFNIDL